MLSKTQFTLVQGIVAHPDGSPSLENLNEMFPSLDREQIPRQLQKLISDNIVAIDDVSGKSRYRLTKDGRKDLEGTGIFDAENTLHHYYRKSDP